jgi:dephospho-CoA kinase
MNTPRGHKPVIGIIGGVGAGKTVVAEEFEKLGCRRIDGDAIGHALLLGPAVRDRLGAEFGPEVFDKAGAVDRSALARIVFDDADRLADLNRILHPLIRERIVEQIRLADADTPAIVLDAAVLLEAGWDELCTCVVFVCADATQRGQRVRTSRGWDDAAWRGREKMQISLDKKRAGSDHVIDNRSSAACLPKQVRVIFELIGRSADPTQ